MAESLVEPWLRGTYGDVDAVRRQVVHALELAGEDVARWCEGLSDAEMHARPFGVASVAYQMRHMVRSLDRLLTYAEGRRLSAEQLSALAGEMPEGATGVELFQEFRAPEQICARMNDPCDSRQFDEDIRSLASDGHGRFGFLALQSASHSEVEGQSPKTVVAQTVLYLYASTQDGWRYCERKVDDSEIEALDKELKFHLSNIAASCAPNLSVVPDMSTADDNPFLKH